jgi:CubicO group peptidase (beta-lactamase class C family)
LFELSAAVDLGKLDAYLESSRQTWGVPGMAVAIVNNGEVVLSRGYGVLEMGRAEKVDTDTLFAIASNTKAFTAAALAVLVEEGKVTWDDPVRKHLPYFELYNPYVSEEMRIRDLLCHRSGLGTFSGDLLWYLTSYSPEEVIHRARHLKPAGAFRASYGYSNLMFITAGEVISAVSGRQWGDFIRQRILEVAGMSRTFSSVRDLAGMKNVATPHADFDGDLVTHSWASWDAMAAAGGIISSANDMTRWLRLQLNRGHLNGRRVFGEESSRTMWTAHIALPVTPQSERQYPSTHFRAYGLGWNLFDYLGHKVVQHGGAYDGMFSRVALVPEKNLGLVVLTNSTTSLPVALMYQVLDAYLDAPERVDWSAKFLQRVGEAQERRNQRLARGREKRIEGTDPSLPLGQYLGRFGGDLYGDAEVRLEEGRLVLKLLPAPELEGDLNHWHLDTFEIQWRKRFPWFGKGKVQFLLDADGAVTEFRMDVPNEDFWFYELEFKKRD